MLVLSRKPGEKVLIGEDITITVLRASGGRVRLGVDAPDHIDIRRAELAESEAARVRERPGMKPL
jgi:carbon storage regulator